MALVWQVLVALQLLCGKWSVIAQGGQLSKPRFMGPVTNYTAAVGKTAELKCRVQNLHKYKVVWFHLDRKMLLTIDQTLVTRIPRFRVTGDDNSTLWTLHIHNVEQDDRGQYMCQINTEPMMKNVGFLDVVVPPVIDDGRSSLSSVVVQENGNVTLVCEAEGNPAPHISWMREDKKHITLTKRRKVLKHEGSRLELRKVSRRDMGAYLCIASNGVPPSVSKRIELKVQFSPIVLLPNQLMSAPLGSSVWLECKTEAYPRAVTFWKHNHTMVMSTNKYQLDEYHHDDYTTTVKLTIKQLEPGDFGKYLCYSRNSFGENDGTVELHELKREQHEGRKMKEFQELDGIPEMVVPGGREGLGQNQVILDHNDGGLASLGTTSRKESQPGHSSPDQTTHLGLDHGNPPLFPKIMSGTAGSPPSVGCVVVLLVALVLSLR